MAGEHLDSSPEERVTEKSLADNAELVLITHPILTGRAVSPLEQVDTDEPEEYFTIGGPRG